MEDLGAEMEFEEDEVAPDEAQDSAANTSAPPEASAQV